MSLCICGGIVEIGALLLASLVFVFPFLGKYLPKRKCCKKEK